MSDLPEDSYCCIARGHALHGPYHDHEYGFPTYDDNALFRRMLLEINQAGLSWVTILKKQEGFRAAYSDFSVDAVAKYGEADRARLLADTEIIRNRLKVDAAISNAQEILKLRASHGSFAGWLDTHHPREKVHWVRLFKKTFRFTGGEITSAFLISVGYLPGAHVKGCPVFAEVAALKPRWMD